jgi:hypothetical protein
MSYSRTCGGDHRTVMLVTLILGILLFGLMRFAAPRWMVYTASQLTLLIGFALVGGTLLRHRKELGIAEDHRAVREAERVAGRLARLRERMLEQAYVKIKVGKPLDGWREIQTWISQHGRGETALEERRAVLAVAAQWDDPRPADRLADDLIALLLSQGDTPHALETLEQRLAQNPRFLPSSSQRARLADLAGRAGKPALRRQLEAAGPPTTQHIPTPRGSR